MADQILNLNGKQAAAGSGVINIVPADYISGLKMVWVSATALTVTTGAACRPSDSLLMAPAANIAKTALALTASTWYHVYLYMNGANPDIEIVTTAPAAPYSGTACAKTGDTSRRYIGSVLTDASGNIIRFDQTGNRIDYMMSINNAPLHPLNYAGATITTPVSLAAAIPVTARRAAMYLENSTTNGSIAYISVPPLASLADVITFVRPGGRLSALYVVDSTQSFNYAFNGAPAAGTGLDAWVTGYVYER
ncbi:MAG TPA: hypothetical protein VN039_10515 [Nitrospira sp.]|nr:hypothetical protein [Nitrospira sp.]